MEIVGLLLLLLPLLPLLLLALVVVLVEVGRGLEALVHRLLHVRVQAALEELLGPELRRRRELPVRDVRWLAPARHRPLNQRPAERRLH